jgi:DNA-binding response OmpR family regulator
MAKKILIIEDEESLVELLVTKLEKEGYEVESAYNGEEGYAKIENFKPDLILLDIVMPKMDGYEVLEKIKENNIKSPVIVISNSGQPVEIEKTRKLGAVDHLIKTEFNPDDVLTMVLKYFGDSKEEKKEEEKKEEAPIAGELEKHENDDVKKLDITVLLVEDDNFLREICTKKLVKDGYTVYTAIDGEQAIANVEKIDPDIVLLDIILPALDGFQILEFIRKSKKASLKDVPVVMLSNLGQEDDIKKAMDMGANDYLVKAHFTTEEIANKIQELLGK